MPSWIYGTHAAPSIASQMMHMALLIAVRGPGGIVTLVAPHS
jgi:hypothetical protein